MTATGKRDKLITFERDTGTGKDDHGGKIEDWQPVASEWAKVIFGTGAERREAAQQSASQAVTFNVRANDKTVALTPLHRVTGYLGAVWEITSVAPYRDEVDITAVRKAA